MKRTRFGSRDRLSRDAAELQRLATGLSESGGKLEDSFWENQLAELVDDLLKGGAEDDINTALDRLFEANPRAHDELADMTEARAETGRLTAKDQEFDIQLFSAPILAWSRFSIPACALPQTILEALTTQLGAHVFGADIKVGLADYLFSPDQLPRSFCPQVIHINIAILQCFYHHDFHAGHYSTGRVSSMCRYWYQHHSAVMVSPAFMVSFYCKQSCIFTLCAAVGLQAAGIKSSDLT